MDNVTLYVEFLDKRWSQVYQGANWLWEMGKLTSDERDELRRKADEAYDAERKALMERSA